MKPKILVGLSSGEYLRKADFLASFIGLERPEGCFTITVHGQSPAKSRNIIIEKAIEHKCTHILFVDDDMIIPPDTLTKLLSHNKDIVTGLYLLRTFPHYPALFDEAYSNGKCKYTFLNNQEAKLVPAINCGLGCVLIKTDVFKFLEKPWVRLGELEQDEWCDDIGFFNRCRKAGFEIFCDLNSPIGHMTNVTIWPERIDGKWVTNYKHQNGNIHIMQQTKSAKEIEEEASKQNTELVESR